MTEFEETVLLANKLLDEPWCDPDDRLRMLARQFVRATEHWRLVTDYAELVDAQRYIVCPINARADGTLYLGQPRSEDGWAIKRLTKGCYAALAMPEFNGR
jgi:hypothetical protein